MDMVTQMDSSTLEAHRRSIRIGGTDPKICSSPIETMGVSVKSSPRCNPVVPGTIVCSKFLVQRLTNDGGHRRTSVLLRTITEWASWACFVAIFSFLRVAIH